MSEMNESSDNGEEQYEEGEDEEGEEAQAAADAAQEQGGAQGGHPKTWYPYITKTQFEKFISRLQGKMPDQVDRDYVRAIIRTPSMIYRFLRGIEAMRLIDRDHRPTERLRRLIVPETRKQAVGDVIKDLYPELYKQWEEKHELPDHEVTAFFRRKTGMGNDSATKMRMFFKFLMAEGDLEGSSDAAPETPRAATAAPVASAPAPRHEPETPRRGGDRPAPQERAERVQAERSSERSSAAERSAERAQAAERERAQASDSSQGSQAYDRPFNSNRALSETQRAYLETLQGVLNINIDGDWDEDMIRLVFDRLERLYDRVRRG